METWWWFAPVLAALVAAAWYWQRPWRAKRMAAHYDRARRAFHQHREHLEARFLQLAGAAGKPRGLRWANCEFEDDVSYARDRKTEVLCAFVGCTISFEAIVGGGMEEVEAVGNLRAATAVFRYDAGRWTTDGRALFNVEPSEAIARFSEELILVGRETAG